MYSTVKVNPTPVIKTFVGLSNVGDSVITYCENGTYLIYHNDSLYQRRIFDKGKIIYFQERNDTVFAINSYAEMRYSVDKLNTWSKVKSIGLKNPLLSYEVNNSELYFSTKDSIYKIFINENFYLNNKRNLPNKLNGNIYHGVKLITKFKNNYLFIDSMLNISILDHSWKNLQIIKDTYLNKQLKLISVSINSSNNELCLTLTDQNNYLYSYYFSTIDEISKVFKDSLLLFTTYKQLTNNYDKRKNDYFVNLEHRINYQPSQMYYLISKIKNKEVITSEKYYVNEFTNSNYPANSKSPIDYLEINNYCYILTLNNFVRINKSDTTMKRLHYIDFDLYTKFNDKESFSELSYTNYDIYTNKNSIYRNLLINNDNIYVEFISRPPVVISDLTTDVLVFKNPIESYNSFKKKYRGQYLPFLSDSVVINIDNLISKYEIDSITNPGQYYYINYRSLIYNNFKANIIDTAFYFLPRMNISTSLFASFLSGNNKENFQLYNQPCIFVNKYDSDNGPYSIGETGYYSLTVNINNTVQFHHKDTTNMLLYNKVIEDTNIFRVVYNEVSNSINYEKSPMNKIRWTILKSIKQPSINNSTLDPFIYYNDIPNEYIDFQSFTLKGKDYLAFTRTDRIWANTLIDIYDFENNSFKTIYNGNFDKSTPNHKLHFGFTSNQDTIFYAVNDTIYYLTDLNDNSKVFMLLPNNGRVSSTMKRHNGRFLVDYHDDYNFRTLSWLDNVPEEIIKPEILAYDIDNFTLNKYISDSLSFKSRILNNSADSNLVIFSYQNSNPKELITDFDTKLVNFPLVIKPNSFFEYKAVIKPIKLGDYKESIRFLSNADLQDSISFFSGRVIDSTISSVENDIYLYHALPYPMPVKDYFNCFIAWDTRYNIDDAIISITDINGNKLPSNFDYEINKESVFTGYLKVDCSSLPNGIYFIGIKHSDKNRSIPIIVSK